MALKLSKRDKNPAKIAQKLNRLTSRPWSHGTDIYTCDLSAFPHYPDKSWAPVVQKLLKEYYDIDSMVANGQLVVRKTEAKKISSVTPDLLLSKPEIAKFYLESFLEFYPKQPLSPSEETPAAPVQTAPPPPSDEEVIFKLGKKCGGSWQMDNGKSSPFIGQFTTVRPLDSNAAKTILKKCHFHGIKSAIDEPVHGKHFIVIDADLARDWAQSRTEINAPTSAVERAQAIPRGEREL